MTAPHPNYAIKNRQIIAETDQRADDRQFVGHAGQLWHQFANLNARHIGGNRLKLAADLGRSIRLEIIHIEMGRPAGQQHHDDGFGLGLRQPAGATLGFRSQDIRQSQTSQRKPANLQATAAGHAITKT